MFLIRPDRSIYYLSVQSMPFVRPPFSDMVQALDAVIDGSAEMSHGAAYYWQNKSQALSFFTLISSCSSAPRQSCAAKALANHLQGSV